MASSLARPFPGTAATALSISILSLALSVGIQGCAAGSDDNEIAAGGESGSTGGTGGGGPGAGTGGNIGVGGGSTVPGCRDGAEDIFVLGFDLTKAVLYRFDPLTFQFDELGPLQGCPAGTGFAGKNPWSAALDRNGVILAHYLEWDSNLMQFVYDRVHTIDAATGTCTDMGAGLTHPMGTARAAYEGMAFLPDPGDPTKDILFASARATATFDFSVELESVDTSTFAMTPIGTIWTTQDNAFGYLASAGDGRLFTYSSHPQVGLRELDPETANGLSDQSITGLDNSSGPFVFWGGSLWFFWFEEYDPNALQTDVYRVDMNTWQATKVTSVDFIATAAAVSTCAPLEIPK